MIRTTRTKWCPRPGGPPRRDYESYLEWRDGTGDTAMFRQMLTGDMEVSYYDEVFTITQGPQT